MRTLKTLKRGQPGTKALVARYGANLLCVRYDEATRERLELIVERKSRRPATVPPPTRRISLRIGWRETALRQRVKAAGGRWDPAARGCIIRRDHAERLGLLDRLVGRGGKE